MTDRFERFVSSVEGMYKCIQRIKRQEMGEFGLRGTHVMCLYFLSLHPEGLTVTRLAASCGEDKAAVSRTAAELEERGLTVCAGAAGKKRYRTPICLTEQGREVALRMNQIIEAVVLQADQGLTEEELEVFYSALGRIAGNLEAYQAEKES